MKTQSINMGKASDNALLLNAEISAAVTIMRQMPKWSLIPRRYSDDEDGDEPLLEDFKLLRRKVFTWEDWSAVQPLEFLEPFLEVIRSPEVSGPVTGVALTGLYRMLNKYIFGNSSKGIAEALHAIAEAVTECKYESADAASDEVALFEILQVLLALLRCPGTNMLTDENIKAIFEACYRIGQLQSEGGKSLLDASQQTMHEIVTIIFSRLDELSVVPGSSIKSLHHQKLHELHQSPASPLHSAPPQAMPDATPTPPASLATTENAESMNEGAPTGTEQMPMAQPRPGVASNGIVSVAKEPAARDEDKADSFSDATSKEDGSKKSLEGYGLASITTIFEYTISWIASDKEEEVVFGLDLATAALNSGGAAFKKHKVLMDLVVEHLCQALYEAARFNNLSSLSGLCQAALSLYVHMGSHLLLHLEALIGTALLRIAEGKGKVDSLDMQEAALEGLLDFVNQPNFVQDVYINLDCRIERSNLYEKICALLSKTAFPVNSPLGSVHLLSLDGLFAILATLSQRCEGVHSPEELTEQHDPDRFVSIWDALCKGQSPPIDGLKAAGLSHGSDNWVHVVRIEKYLKGRLALAADHFNRDHKKGFQFLQSINLLPKDMDPVAVAKFLRVCPALSKTTIGELLGEADDFYLKVLDAFTKTFSFKAMNFDTAIRTYLETFRLPGEAQKINRIMESFGKHYHEQCPGHFKHSDAVYILAYSVIMLNTDQHNEQVKKKMTVEEYIRNNRGINGGDDLPVALLRNLYESIRKNEIRIYNDGDSSELSPVFWSELVTTSHLPRGQMIVQEPGVMPTSLYRDMFSLIWGPTLAAVSVVLDHSTDINIVQQALEGVKLAAKMAAYHGIDQVMDSLIISLSKFTMLLNPSAQKPTVAFGEDGKARMAMETIFTIANMYGDSLRSGWKNIVDIVLRLHKLDLLPAAVFILESDNPEEAKQRIPRPNLNKRSNSATSLLSRAISSLISIEGGDTPPEQPTTREVDATQRTLLCIEACHIDEVFADSKFLIEPALSELVATVKNAAGPMPPRNSSGAEDFDTAEVCVELLITLALRNRDRILLLWPALHDFLAAVMDERAFKHSNSLVERSVFGLLRVCQRLLPYKEDVADTLLKSLKLISRLNANVAWELAEDISLEVLSLLKTSAGYIRTSQGWAIVCLLLVTTSIHPGAASNVFEALGHICQDKQLLNEANYLTCLETAMRFVEQYSKDATVERSMQALQMVDSMFQWLLWWHNQSNTSSAKQTRLEEFWWATVSSLALNTRQENAALRNTDLETLKRTLSASEILGLPPALYVKAVHELLVPMVTDLARIVSSKNRQYREADKSLRIAVKVLTKTVLQYMPCMLTERSFPEMWNEVLTVLQTCTHNASEDIAEEVPEAVKNMLLVMAAKGILQPEWTDAQGHNLWDATWNKAKTISSGLSPPLLSMSGIPGFEPEPEPTPTLPASQEPEPSPPSTSIPTDDVPLPMPTSAAIETTSRNDIADASAAAISRAGPTQAGPRQSTIEVPQESPNAAAEKNPTSYAIDDTDADSSVGVLSPVPSAAAVAAEPGGERGVMSEALATDEYTDDEEAKQAAGCKQS